MSVCFVSTDAGESEEGADGGLQVEEESQGAGTDSHYILAQFWERVMEDIRKVACDDYKQQVLPLARVKKIMKLDEEVKMISAEAPLLFAKAAEIFIHELTLRAWVHTEDNKRRTLQRNDIAMAIIKSDQFDFLIDIVPRQDMKPAKAREETTARTAVSQDQVHYYFQLAQQHQAALQAPQTVSAQIHQTQQAAQAPQQAQVLQVAQQQQQPTLQIVQQIVTPGGEIQQIPIQLTPAQMNLIRMQMQGNSQQPIIIQTSPVNTQQQLIHLNTVPQQQQSHPVYLTQVATSQEGE